MSHELQRPAVEHWQNLLGIDRLDRFHPQKRRGKIRTNGFWLVLGTTFLGVSVYALYRMTQRAAIPAGQTESYLNVLPSSSAVAVEAAGAWSADQASEEDPAGA